MRIAVRDTGIGIPADRQELLFQRFSNWTYPPRASMEAPALGLAICKQLAELMGGRVGLESEAGKVRYSSCKFPWPSIPP